MAPNKKSAGAPATKNPHMRLVHGKLRFNPNTNVPVNHAGCVVTLRSKADKERDAKITRTKTYSSNAKGST